MVIWNFSLFGVANDTLISTSEKDVRRQSARSYVVYDVAMPVFVRVGTTSKTERCELLSVV